MLSSLKSGVVRSTKPLRGGLARYVHTSRAGILKEYFETTKFEFKPEKLDKQLALLRNALNTIFLRKTPLVCLDVEAYERNLRKITEVGFAIYDPELSVNSMFPYIQTGHIIIKEHMALVNSKFVPNNKTSFLGGESYMVGLKQCGNIMNELLDEYINKRNGAFVGHHIGGDIKWLKSLNITIKDNAPVIDTCDIYGVSRSRGGTLRGILRLLEIPHGLLHNAGNDSYYTLLSAIALCDPETRIRKGLDKYIDNEPIDKKKQLAMKFSDKATIIQDMNTESIIKRLMDPTNKIYPDDEIVQDSNQDAVNMNEPVTK